MKKLFCALFLLSLSVTSKASYQDTIPSLFQWDIISSYGSGISFRNASDTFSYGLKTNFADNLFRMDLQRYNSLSFLTNGLGSFAAISVDGQDRNFGFYAFNEGRSFFFMGLVRHRFSIGTGYDHNSKSLFPTFEASLMPHLMSIGIELTYRNDFIESRNRNFFELGLTYLW